MRDFKWYCVNNLKKENHTAGNKAPSDCFRIASDMGAEEVVFLHTKPQSNIYLTRIMGLFDGIQNWLGLYRRVKRDSWVVLQHPNENILVANHFIDICKKRKNIHFIALIHDMDSIRSSFLYGKQLSKRNILADETVLKKCDRYICHNEKMKQYMVENGFAEDKIVCLGIFDYLHDCELPEMRKKEKAVVVAGNLMPNKCEYLYKIQKQENLPFTLHLFGPNYEEAVKNANVEYHGSCKPDELPGKLVGSFGLVWDGTELDSCKGKAGEYIRYNNPHKCSLFLASNMPVIIWKEAALASFVEENGVGVTVDSLMEIGSAIESLTEEQYAKMVINTVKVSKHLRSGYYLTQALNKSFDAVQ